MSRPTQPEITAGTILEFFESKEVVCAVCTGVKNNRFPALTEQNREVSLAPSRIVFAGSALLDLKSGRDDLVARLRAAGQERERLTGSVDIAELWSLFEGEEEGFEARDLAGLVFSGALSDDHVAAVQRVLLRDRLYFQYKDGCFYARSREKVEQRREELAREAEREARLDTWAGWLEGAWNRKPRSPLADQRALIETLKDYALFGQDSAEIVFIKELFRRAGIPIQPQSAFRLLVRLGVWQENENLYLHEQGISQDFPQEVEERVEVILHSARPGASGETEPQRRDLRHLDCLTVDSALTRDYDDALSFRALDGNRFEVGIHIADAAEFVRKGDMLDREAERRATSIYLPDARISMLPVPLSEDLCSLKAGEDRPALSFLFVVDGDGTIAGSEIVSSTIRVAEQLTYEEVNERIRLDDSPAALSALAMKLRNARLDRGASILPLPEIQVYVNSAGMIQVSRYEKETPSQIMVSEWMIAANAAAANFLAERDLPSVFRSQGECKQETDFTQSEHELFRIYRQRRLYARAELDTRAKQHCSLAQEHYTTVTSPIRRYTDLVVQRQIKQALQDGPPLYDEDELRGLITRLTALQSRIAFIQRKWTRYWILKYLEQEDIHSLNALILEQNERYSHLLLPDFLIETNAHPPENVKFQPGEMVRVKIDRLNPREDILRVQLPDFGK